MTTLTNSFEGGTSGTTITAANSGGASGNAFDVVSTGASVTNAFDSAQAAHGTLGYKNATGATSASSYVEWSTSLTGTSITQVWYRAYLYYTANPTVQHRIVNILNGGTSVGSTLVTTAGKIIVTDTAGNTKITTTATIPLNAWFRIEGYYLTSVGGTTGQVELKLFTSNPDGTTPDETDTSTATLSNSTAITAIRIGVSSNTANVVAHWFDDLGASDSGYIGPVGGGGTAATASGSLGIAGTAAAQAPAAPAGAVALTGAATAQAPAAPAGSMALAGTAAAQAPAAPAGSLSLAGTGTATGPGTTAAGTLSLAGTAAGQAPAAAAGTFTLTGTAAPAAPAGAAGSIALAGTGPAPAATASGSLGIVGTAAAVAQDYLVVVADMQPATGANVPPQVVSAQVRSLSPSPAYVLIPGDVANDGTTAEYGVFDQYYGATATSPSTNLFSLLRPVPGNHDHAPNGDPANTPTNLVAYDAYFGAEGHPSATPPHFYSFDTPSGWHIIGLDSGTQWIGSVANPSATYTALAADLASNRGKPIIAFWHHPRWSDGTNTADPGGTGDTTELTDIWNLLRDYACDLVFSGHCHSYQRFPKFGKTGSSDSLGIREFVVGSGGSGLFTLTGAGRADINSYQAAAYDQVNSKWFGYLNLWLSPTAYSWQFVSQDAVGSEAPGAVLDSGGPVPTNLSQGATQPGATASGSLALAGTAAAQASAAAAGSLTLAGTGTASGPGSTAAGLLSVAGTATAGAPAAAGANLTVAGNAAAAAPVTSAGAVAITGTAAATGPGTTAAGTLAVSGTAAARAAAAAAGGVAMTGTAAGRAAAASAGVIVLAGTAALAAQAAAAGSIALAGTGVGKGPVTYGTAVAGIMTVPAAVAGVMTVPSAQGGSW